MNLSADGRSIELPALASAHSHAFQRAMRGSAQARGRRRRLLVVARVDVPGGARLDPTSIEAISRVAFRELRHAGVRTVGEFHYVHHQPDGTPYDERTLMSEAVIRAAKAEGLRIALLRVAYHRAGPGRAAEPEQLRFCDPTADAVVRDVEALRKAYASDRDVVVGLAPHSVRAVPPEWIRDLAAYAEREAMPFHMHVAEQPREIAECVAETGKRPVELLSDLGALSDRFVAVHATHLLPHEAVLLGKARSFACVCATTEADLGDGIPDLVALRSSAVRLCTGIDSHVITDPLADVRALETLARLRSGTRVTFAPSSGSRSRSPAEQMWREGSIEGAAACGFQDAGGTVRIARDDPALALVEDELLLDAIVFGGTPAMFSERERERLT